MSDNVQPTAASTNLFNTEEKGAVTSVFQSPIVSQDIADFGSGVWIEVDPIVAEDMGLCYDPALSAEDAEEATHGE